MARSPNQDANLKPIKKGDLSNEELKRRQSNGGKKSGEVRRAKKDARETIRYILGLAPTKALKQNLDNMNISVGEQTNMAALQARIFAKAMSGDLVAYETIMRYGGFEPEENRKERESLATEARRKAELEAKITALGVNADSITASLNMSDEDGNNDVVIYMPKIASEESCTYKKDSEDTQDTSEE